MEGLRRVGFTGRMSGFLTAATLVTALGSALVAGIFFAFSAFVMRALGDLPPAQGIAAMQSINRAAVRPPLLIALMGTALACAGLGVGAFWVWDEPFAGRLVAGAGLYLAGAILPTAAYHVPRNEALGRVRPDDAGAAAHWMGYPRGWTAWNHLRVVGSLAAAAALIDAVRVG
jgi:uncharacterized membrane protein